MTLVAESISGKLNHSRGLNVCLYDAAGNPIVIYPGGGLASTIIGPDGTPAKVVGENCLRVVAQSYAQAISQGDISGHSPFFKLGYSPASSGSQTTLWNPHTQYVWPSAAMQMEVVSTDNTNDKSGGTGALTMHLHYLDGSYASHVETITLNGTTAVPTEATNIFRINSFHVLSTGSSGVAAGTISIRNATDHTTVYSQCAAGFTRSRNSAYTVPAGKTLFISDIGFSAGYSQSGKEVRLTLHANLSPMGTLTTAGLLFFPQAEIVLVDGSFVNPTNMIYKFPATTDIKCSVIGETNAITTSTLGGWLE